MAMMAITTSSSISVNPRRRELGESVIMTTSLS
jgi:hypothetical protein